MLQIQILTLRHKGTYSLSAIERYSENLAKLLLLGHYSALQAQAQDVFDLSHSLLEFKGARLQQGYTLLSISLHNMWVYLEKAKTVFEDSLAESTGLQEFDQTKILQKSEEIETQINIFVQHVIQSKELAEVIGLVLQNKGLKSVESTLLLETVKHLNGKYPNHNNTFEQIHRLVTDIPVDMPSMTHINQTLLNKSSKQLVQFITLNHLSSQKMLSLCLILTANSPKRQPFLDSIPTSQVLTNILTHIITSNSCNLLFSLEHFKDSPLCSFVSSYMQFQFLDVYLKFCNIFTEFKMYKEEVDYYNNNLPLVEQVVQLMQTLIPSGFSNFLSLVFQVLTKHKHTQEESIEIMKLLVLNRFLLDPQIRHPLTPLDHDFSLHSNRIRNVFFPTKLRHIPSIVSTSFVCYHAFSRLCQASDQSKSVRTLVITDQTLQVIYSHISLETSENTRRQVLMNPRSPSNFQGPNTFQSPSSTPIHPSSADSHILNEIQKNGSMCVSAGESEMKRHLIEYKTEWQHGLSQFLRHIEYTSSLDEMCNQRFRQVSQSFNHKRQQMLEAKKVYRVNACYPV